MKFRHGFSTAYLLLVCATAFGLAWLVTKSEIIGWIALLAVLLVGDKDETVAQWLHGRLEVQE